MISPSLLQEGSAKLYFNLSFVEVNGYLMIDPLEALFIINWYCLDCGGGGGGRF